MAARDVRLSRDVALKFLPEAFARALHLELNRKTISKIAQYVDLLLHPT